MKLAEALLERANAKQKLVLLNNRLMRNALVQEGLKPNEDPKDLLSELDTLLERYEYLIARINLTNMATARATRSEIRVLPTFSIANMQKQINNISEQIRKTDTEIQELNWTTDLM